MSKEDAEKEYVAKLIEVCAGAEMNLPFCHGIRFRS